MDTLEIMVATNLGAFIFGAGALWQKVKSIDERVKRIETTLNGQLTKGKH